jgi:hypothetical protein
VAEWRIWAVIVVHAIIMFGCAFYVAPWVVSFVTFRPVLCRCFICQRIEHYRLKRINSRETR